MKKLYQRLIIFAIIIIALVLFYALGPAQDRPLLDNTLPVINTNISQVEDFISAREDTLPVKVDNESKIIWNNDSLKNKTEYCLLYLHGFAASGYEGYPTHTNFAKHFNCNAYIPRLASHGLGELEPMLDFTADKLYDSAKEALQIAHILGEKVIIMSTSTGGTLSLKLAAEFPELVDGLLLLSPNIKLHNKAAFLLSKPWGLEIAQQLEGGKYHYFDENTNDEKCKYWNCFYRLEAVVQLQLLIESSMSTETFQQVTTPVFLAYYYEDKEHQDDIVQVDAMLDMFDELGTDESKKEKQAYDAGTHVIGCEMLSQTRSEIEEACFEFASNVLGM